MSHGKRTGKGVLDIETALSAAGIQGWDVRQNEYLIQIGEQSGAFRTGGRSQKGGVTCKTVLEPVRGWTRRVSDLSDGVSDLSDGVSDFSDL